MGSRHKQRLDVITRAQTQTNVLFNGSDFSAKRMNERMTFDDTDDDDDDVCLLDDRQSSAKITICGKSDISLEQLQQLNDSPYVPALETEQSLLSAGQRHGLQICGVESVVRRRQQKRRRKAMTTTKKRRKEKAIESERKYWAEAVVSVRLTTDSELQYLVKWESYPMSDNTWQNINDLFDCDQLFRHFVEQNFPQGVHYTTEDMQRLCEELRTEDVAVLLRVNGLRLSQWERSERHLRSLRTRLDVCLRAIECLRRRVVTSRRHPKSTKDVYVWPQRILISYVVRELDIERHFGSLEDFFRFCEGRRRSQVALKEWCDDVNEQLFALGLTRDAISVENSWDTAVPPKIRYLTEYKLHPEVTVEDRNVAHIHCVCEDNCRRTQCKCALKLYKDLRRFKTSHVVYECNEDCDCDDTCSNRRVQKRSVGRDLVVTRTDGRGWGVVTARRIEYKGFIMEYLGEVLTSLQTRTRDETYFFNIDSEFCGERLFIDGRHNGNVARFANHSCRPNMDLHLAVVSKKEIIPRIAFFANRVIKAGEELTWDYGRQTLTADRNGNYVDSSDAGSQDSGYSSSDTRRAPRPDDITCLCGEDICKQFL